MNYLNYNQAGGFRLSTNILAAAQAAYNLFNSLGWIAGDKTIISGCEVIGNTVSDGVVFINGELFTFKGGNIGTNVIIRENITPYPFKDGVYRDVIHERYVSFGSSTPENTYLWADFKRIFQTKDIQEFKNNHNTRIEALEGKQAFFVGMIIRYDQPMNIDPPPGWIDHIPVNEQGRVWVSRSTSDGDFGLGSTGGSKTHQLSITEMPPHAHGMSFRRDRVGNGNENALAVHDNPNWSRNTSTAGGENNSAKAHNNLQPYIGVRFIKYIGL